MSVPTIKSLMETVAEQPDVDSRAYYQALWTLLGALRAKLDARFELHPEPSTAGLQPYQSPGGEAQGFLSAFSGPEIDWMVHSWIGTPAQTFSNMHLTVWLGPQTRVPHFGMALGTMPDLFFYIDYIPRVDLWVQLDYLDRYYEPANQSYLKLAGHAGLSPFVSKSLYMRQAQSETSLCFMAKPTPESLALIEAAAHEMMDRWLAWIDQGDPVEEGQRAALQARDRLIRRAIAERDPANPMAEQLFGKAFSDRLVRALWGGDR